MAIYRSNFYTVTYNQFGAYLKPLRVPAPYIKMYAGVKAPRALPPWITSLYKRSKASDVECDMAEKPLGGVATTWPDDRTARRKVLIATLECTA